MIAFFSNWAQGIIIAVIVATIIEMILPNGTCKKYVKVVIGIYILFTIVSPAIEKFANGKIDVNTIIKESYATEMDSSSQNIEALIETNNNRSVKEIYVSNLKNDVKNKLKQKGYEVTNTYIEVSNDGKYNIEKISVSIKKNKSEESQSNSLMGNSSAGKSSTNNTQMMQKNKISIDQIEIRNNNTASENITKTQTESVSTDEVEDLKEYISESYSVSKDLIEVLFF